MFNLLFMLSRLFWVPYGLITAPFRASSSVFQDSGRGRAMMLGLPAVLVALGGVGVLAFANWGNQANLENTYKNRAEKSSEEKARLANEINMQQRLSAARNRTQPGSATIDKDDPRMIKLRELNDEEEIYLEKLIWLNTDEPDYRYRLAIVALQSNDPQRCFSLMRSIAPDEEPGFAKAHLWMAKNYLKQRVSSNAQAKEFQTKALVHAEHCLVRDNNNEDAKLLKAQLLFGEKRYIEAYQIYEELFDKYPRFYRQLIELNEILGGENVGRNSIILDQAQLRFKEVVDKASVDYSPIWSRAWINLITCLREKKAYEVAVDLLTKEEETQRNLAQTEGTPDAASRHVHIKQLLTGFYTYWASQIGGENVTEEMQQLELLKKALKFDMNNPQALQLVARISAGDNAAAIEAKTIYDPEKHDDAPAPVLNEMGSRSLNTEKYDLAIKYFELARRKSPNDPQILNNLAYAYLVCENRNPDRALTLVNQAIRAIQRVSNREEQMLFLSHFYDTRGRALMQMDRMDEAAAALELAAQERPDNEGIIEALIECYDGRDNLQADTYRARLKRIRAKAAEKSEADAGTN